MSNFGQGQGVPNKRENQEIDNMSFWMLPGQTKVLMALNTWKAPMPSRISRRRTAKPEYHHYPSKLARISETTYSHTVLTLKDFEERGLVRKTKIGRITTYELTKSGEETVKWIKDFKNLLKLPKDGLNLKEV